VVSRRYALPKWPSEPWKGGFGVSPAEQLFFWQNIQRATIKVWNGESRGQLDQSISIASGGPSGGYTWFDRPGAAEVYVLGEVEVNKDS